VPIALIRIVDSDYFRTLAIPLKAGRDFTPADSKEAPPVAIISEEQARQFWKDENPIGKTIRVSGGADRVIIGVVSNVRSQQLVSESQPEMYLPQTQTRTMTFVLHSAIPSAQIISEARRIIRATDANLPIIRPGTLQALVDLQMARTEFCLLLAGLFSLLAAVLASVGTYGVVAYAVVQRTREIGLRLALGSTPRKLVFRIMWEGFRPALIGMTLGVAGSFLATRTIQTLLFQVRPNDPATFIAVVLFLAALVLAATAIPASRATRVSPASSLRSE